MAPRANLIIGLTGGMGCGKSTAAALFAEQGFIRLDADQVVREELLPLAEIVAAIREKFGSGVLDRAGQVDRARLAEVVFADEVALRWLENLLHPLLRARWEQRFGTTQGQRYVAEVPLLFEQGMENWFDFTVCITTDAASQIRRLEERGITPTLARQRITRQWPLARKCELADFVLLNDGSLEFLRDQITALVQSFPTQQPA